MAPVLTCTSVLRCRNNAIDTVDVNANSAVDIFGTHTHKQATVWNNDVGCHGV